VCAELKNFARVWTWDHNAPMTKERSNRFANETVDSRLAEIEVAAPLNLTPLPVSFQRTMQQSFSIIIQILQLNKDNLLGVKDLLQDISLFDI